MWDFFIFSLMTKNIFPTCFLGVAALLLSCGETRQVSQNTEIGNPVANVETENAIIEVPEERISRDLEYLSSDELMGRKTGGKGIEKAALYIEEVFRRADLPPFFETYRDTFAVKDVTGYNIVALKEGTDPDLKKEFIIIGAHYDHIGFGKPVAGDSLANGANDNASGTVAVMELARQFEGIDTKRSILFALYSAEEMGLVGSDHLAKRLKKEDLDLYAMLSIEMIGVPMQEKDYAAYVTGFEISNLAEHFNAYSDEKVLGFLPQAKEYNLFRRSDNYPFFKEFQVPAQTISTFDFTNYEYYHHVDDEFEHMDSEHMVELIEKLIPGIAGMANSMEREIKMNE